MAGSWALAMRDTSLYKEAIWGADPLEYWGGFKNLSFDPEATFSSALATNGSVGWSLAWANVTDGPGDQSRAELTVGFSEVDWKLLQSFYGWSALQYQAWCRGYLQVNSAKDQTVAVMTDGIMDIFIDGQRYFGGDFYSYRKAPLLLNLSPGEHIVDLRLIRDVRAMGGQDIPTISVVFEAEVRYELLTIDERNLLIPEVTGGTLGSTWASVNVQNNAAQWVEIVYLNSSDCDLRLEKSLHLAPCQTRPLSFQFAPGTGPSGEIVVSIYYKVSQNIAPRIQSFQLSLETRSFSQTQRLTYTHPASIVSYAILRPPPLDPPCASAQSHKSLPVMIALHGAGLDADSAQAREMLDAAYGACAWFLFPSGVTSWSGDDWHVWGVADIKAAIESISLWMEAVGWAGPGILAEDWLVVGHSNGGQGVWFLTTHYPDNIIAAVPVSGYSSIENYVPYNMWQEFEPLVSSILHQSRSSYKHELLLENAAGIPILQQHGSADTNVPAYNPRLMHDLLGETGWLPGYVELPHKGHWFDGVMTTPPLLKFYEKILRSNSDTTPTNYTINIPSSGDNICRGICVDQLQSPDQTGRLHVRRDVEPGFWHIRTRNVHRFHISDRVCKTPGLPVLAIDETGTKFAIDPAKCESTWFVREADGWTSSTKTDWKSLSQRYGRQVGAIDAILRTAGLFTIRICSAGAEKVALQTSRNLLQYFAADSQITSQCDELSTNTYGNVVTLSLRNELPNSTFSRFPIQVADGRLILYQGCLPPIGNLDGSEESDSDNSCQPFSFDHKPAMGALFLRPLDNERLELVVWGADIDGLEQAARLVPTITGGGQPEFLILSESCRWKGYAGLYAAGHFDKFWQISAGSFVGDSA
ncbi:hypothetical protein BJX70DRAFT_401747 [Aspergillus crustosus]